MTPTTRKRLGWALTLTFLFAIFMGAGPGLTLANDGGQANIFGWVLPKLYAWGILWFLVQALTIATAYWFLWRHEPETTAPSANEEERP